MGPETPNNQQPVSGGPEPEAQPMQPPVVTQPIQPMQPVQPVTPMQPVSPMHTTPQPGMAQPAPTKKMKPALLWGLVAGGIALLALAVTLMFVFAGPSKTDYKDAMTAADSAQDAWSKITGVYISNSSTETELKNGVSTLQASKKDLMTQLDVLAKNKAITADKTLQEKWQAVANKKAKFDTALSARIEAYEKIYPVVISINTSPKTVEDARATLRSAQTKIKDITGLQDENNKKYITRISDDFDQMITLVDKVIEMRQDPSKYDSSVMNKYYDVTADLTDADRDWSSNMNKQVDDGSIRKEMSDLSSEISSKYYALK